MNNAPTGNPGMDDEGLGSGQESRPMTCAELVELVTDYLEGALDRDTEARFVLHATSCPGCETYLDQFRATIAALGTLPPETLDDRVRDDLLDAFRGWRDDPRADSSASY